jgi:hypothetical protein
MKQLRLGLACLFLVVLVGGCSNAPDSEMPAPAAGVATAVTTPPQEIVSVVATVSPLPTATTVPTVEPSPVPTPITSSGLVPYPDTLVIIPQCQVEGALINCHDDVLHVSFSYPATWGEVSARLGKGGYSGLAYKYSFLGDSQATQAYPNAGGRSSNFSEGRGRIATDFWGFTAPSQQMCDEQTQDVLCRVVKPGVVVGLYFPIAEQLCAPPAPYFFTGSGDAGVFVNLPEPSLINGFVFITRFIDEEQLKALDGYQDCTAEGQERFDASIHTLMQQVQSGSAPPEVMERVNTVYRLAESLEGIGIGEYQP